MGTGMDDNSIIQLYWDRDTQAISATSEKYGSYCRKIAQNILGDEQDTEECLNDTYLNAWNSMPTHWPELLSAFLGKITRNLSFNRYKRSRAEKRGGGEIALVLEELGDCVSDSDSIEQIIDRQEIIKAVNSFVKALPPVKRNIFVRRCWYADPVSEIARDCKMSQNSVSKTLERTRKQLKSFLEERGFEL